MNARWIVLLGITLELCCWPTAFAQPPLTVAQTEITYLLNFVEISGCEFYRNGSWYDSVQAEKHMHAKLDYLLARNRVNTAEDFIEQVASKSSLSGRSYEVRCGACPATLSGDWLKSALARYRIVAARDSEPL